MAKSIFQKAYDWIDSLKAPQWLVVMLQELQDLMKGILIAAGKSYISYLQSLIAEAMVKPNWTNQQKFEYVFNSARASGIKALVELKDNELNTLINFLYTQIKKALPSD